MNLASFAAAAPISQVRSLRNLGQASFPFAPKRLIHSELLRAGHKSLDNVYAEPTRYDSMWI